MYSSPISDDNFQEAWNYGCKKYRRAKKVCVRRNIAAPAAHLLYFLCFLTLTYGVAYDGFPGTPHYFLEEIPFAARAWNQWSPLLLTAGTDPKQQLAELLLLLYGIPLAGALVLSLLTSLVYHPVKPFLSIDPQMHAEDLLSMSQQIARYQTPWYCNTRAVCSVLFGIILSVFCIFFLTYCRDLSIGYLWTQGGWIQASLSAAAACLFIFLAYQLLNIPLRLVLSLFFICRVPQKFYTDAARYLKLQETKKYLFTEKSKDQE